MTRTMKRMTVAAGIAALSAAAIAPMLSAQGQGRGTEMRRLGPGPGGFPGGRGPGLLGDMGRWFRQLDLTDGQREQVRGVMQAQQTALREIGERMRTAHQGLDALMTADVVDEAAIRAKSADIAAVQADAAVLRANVNQQVFALLTAEQQAKVKELRAAADARQKARAESARERRQKRQP